MDMLENRQRAKIKKIRMQVDWMVESVHRYEKW